ncbi:YbaN family protein [Hoeflea sp. G2-23]|uniref:YbaN family protein n=1 Tax=Hoeflea algicola TaxID=2983763 RepID=A0ABT3Z7N1_9HYPH|nr:YbaN family protein [Hoeflea algicola]MCY0147787.1 YbaN family protein [Hoeflea algicola]
MFRWIFPERAIDLSLRRPLWFTVGILALALGGLGVVLPLLPTTPFIILAAFAFGKSAPRFQQWLEDSRSFGPMIANWREQGAIAPRYKAMAVAMMICSVLLSLALQVSVVVIVVQAVCLTGAAAFVLSRPDGA